MTEDELSVVTPAMNAAYRDWLKASSVRNIVVLSRELVAAAAQAQRKLRDTPPKDGTNG